MPRTKTQSAQKARTKKRALTPSQRLAIDRRQQERRLRESLARIEESIRDDERRVPARYRATVANALCVILHGGHLFAVACAKAYLSRTWRKWPSDEEFWAFVDAENARFEQTMIGQYNDADMVARWNAPDYEVPEDRKAS